MNKKGALALMALVMAINGNNDVFGLCKPQKRVRNTRVPL